MCNNLKNGNRVYKIPEYGFGYKVFESGARGAKIIRSIYKGAFFTRGEWVEWDDNKSYPHGGDGFCFFHTVRDILGFGLDADETAFRIRYRKGLGRRKQSFYMSSLCKEFKILQEVNIKDLK